tara:strand:- start:977 stop:1270 length:294 start_codon:yes stop_codon:yes gene_type:complete
MECLRLIANPVHLLPEKKTITENTPLKLKSDLNLRGIINEKYKNVYLSDLNLKDIVKLIDDYIDDILTQRAVSDCLATIIDNVIENSDKFDFCLPFD